MNALNKITGRPVVDLTSLTRNDGTLKTAARHDRIAENEAVRLAAATGFVIVPACVLVHRFYSPQPARGRIVALVDATFAWNGTP